MVVTPKRAVRHPDGTSPYDQVVLIPGGGAPGTGAREVLDLFSHPESAGVDPSDRRWQGWVSGNVRVAERLAEPSVGYGERADVMHQVEILLEEWRKT